MPCHSLKMQSYLGLCQVEQVEKIVFLNHLKQFSCPKKPRNFSLQKAWSSWVSDLYTLMTQQQDLRSLQLTFSFEVIDEVRKWKLYDGICWKWNLEVFKGSD